MKYQTGDKVTVNAKRYDNEPATVIRETEYCGFYLVILDKYKSDRYYRTHEFGPFAESELTLRGKP